jgi:hypothetical protein
VRSGLFIEVALGTTKPEVLRKSKRKPAVRGLR